MADPLSGGSEVQGEVAHDSPVGGNPVLIGGRASDVIPSDVTADGDAAQIWVDQRGAVMTGGGIGLEVSGSGTAVNQTPIPATECGRFAFVVVSMTGLSLGVNTVEVEGSLDNTTWRSLSLCNMLAEAGKPPNAGLVQDGTYGGNIHGKYFRVRITTSNGGTISAQAAFFYQPMSSFEATTTLLAGNGKIQLWNVGDGQIARVMNSLPVGTEVGLVVRQAGAIDTELPSAATLADGSSNATAMPTVGSRLLGYNGSTWDRLRSDTANGLDVDVTRTAECIADNGAFTDGTSRVFPSGFIFDETAGVALTENDVAAARVDSKRAQVLVIEDETTRGRRTTVTAANALKVDGSAVTQPVSGTVTAANAAGDVASDGVDSGNPVKIGAQARTTDPTAVASADRVNLIADTLGKAVVLQGAVHDQHVDGKAALTTTTAADVIAAQGAGKRIVVTSVLVTNAHATVGTKVEIRDGTTVKLIGQAAAAGGGFAPNAGGTPLMISTANTAVTARCVTTGADVDVFVAGYVITN